MADRLTDFVIKLASDPQAVENFRKDPESSVRAAGLSAAEQTVLASGNPVLMRQAIAVSSGQLGGQAAAEWVIVIVLVKKAEIQDVRAPSAPNFNDVINNLLP